MLHNHIFNRFIAIRLKKLRIKFRIYTIPQDIIILRHFLSLQPQYILDLISLVGIKQLSFGKKLPPVFSHQLTGTIV